MGKSGRWAPGGTKGRNPQTSSWRGGGARSEERDGTSCRTGDIGGRAAGQRVFGCQILAGTGPGPQGPGQGQKPLAGGTGSGTGTRPQSRCWVPSELRALRPACPWTCPRGRGQHPQYGLRPESEQRAARAGSLQSRWPHGRQPLPRFLCLWHCPGVRIYSHFSRE